MKKNTISLILIVALSFSCMCVPPAEAGSSLSVRGASAIIYDVNAKKIIYSKGRLERRSCASITKIVTAMVVLDTVSLKKRYHVSKKASLTQPSKAYLRSGEYYRVEELLHLLLLGSANDAAVCLAEGVGGSEWGFVQKMNAKARSVGASRTRFINASGLPGKNQYTTAYDLVKIMQAAVKYKMIRRIMAKKYYTAIRPSGKAIKVRNHNKLLWQYPSVFVIGKTGFTRAAGRCFLGYAEKNGKAIVFCVLNDISMWTDSKRMLASVFSKNKGTSAAADVIAKNRKWHAKTKMVRIQSALKRAGCDPGGVDGVFGSRTLKAVYQFQRCVGLKADGVVGPQTWGELQRFM